MTNSTEQLLTYRIKDTDYDRAVEIVAGYSQDIDDFKLLTAIIGLEEAVNRRKKSAE